MRILLTIILLLSTSLCYGQGSTPILAIAEEDGTPTTYPYKVKFSNGSVTDNGDGTTSISNTTYADTVSLYVATTGNDTTGNGTVALPWKTIQKGVNEAGKYISPNIITVNVADGTYTEQVTIPYYAIGRLKILGNAANPDNVILNAGNVGTNDAITLFHDNVKLIIDGIKIQTARYGINLDNGNVEIGYCKFYNFTYAIRANNRSSATFGTGYAGNSSADGNNVASSNFVYFNVQSLLTINQALTISKVYSGYFIQNYSRLYIGNYLQNITLIIGANNYTGIILRNKSFGYIDARTGLNINGSQIDSDNSGIQLLDSRIVFVAPSLVSISNTKYGIQTEEKSIISIGNAATSFTYVGVTTPAYLCYSTYLNPNDNLDTTITWFDNYEGAFPLGYGYDYRYLKLDCSNDPLTDDLQITLNADDTTGLYINGATNDYTGSGVTIGLNNTRDYNVGNNAINNAAGIQNYLSPKHTNAVISSNKTNYGIINRIVNTGKINNNNVGLYLINYEYGTYNWLDNNATYNTGNTSQIFNACIGDLIEMDYDATFTDSGGIAAGAANVDLDGVRVELYSNPTLTSGGLIIQSNGMWIDVQGTTVGTNSVARGIMIYKVEGCDSNWGIYDTSGADWLLNTDSQKLKFGAYNPSGDSYIEFDGNSLNIVGNQVTATDDIELTADTIVCNGYIIPKTSADADAPNNSIYYSSTAGKLVYKDSGGTVNNLY